MEQQTTVTANGSAFGEGVPVEALLAERDRLAALLLSAEQRLADLPSLETRIHDLERALGKAHDALRDGDQRMQELDDRFMSLQRVLTEVMNSPSWRVTKPLRLAKKLLRS